MNIKEYLDILKDLWTPTNASKIRMAISNALEMMGNNLKENIDRQDNVENQFQDVLDETTGKDVINGPEIIAARNGETNLKARLDKEKNEVAAQLAQTKSTLEARKLNRNENESISMAMLKTDIKEAIVGGTFEFNVNSSNIENGAVKDSHISEKGINLNKVNIDTNGFLTKTQIFKNNVTMDSYLSTLNNYDIKEVETYSIVLTQPEIAFQNNVISKNFVYGDLIVVDDYISSVLSQTINQSTTYKLGVYEEIIHKGNINELLYKQKKITMAVLGDSLSAIDPQNITKGYLYKMGRDYPVFDIFNYAVSGASLTDRGEEMNNVFKPIFEQMYELKQNHEHLDVITVFAMINDWQSRSPIGTIEDTTNETILGSYNNILYYLRENFPESFINIVTPIQRGRYVEQLDNPEVPQEIKNWYINNPLNTYVDDVLKYAETKSIPVFDAYHKSGLNLGNGVQDGHSYHVQNFTGSEDGTNPDRLHLNSRGHDVWFRKYVGFLNSNLGL